MAYITQWLNEQMQARTADSIIDDTLHYLKSRNKLLDGFMPVTTYDTFDVLKYVVQDLRTVASVIPFGGEIPLRNQGRFTKLTGELFKIGTGRRYDEERQIALRKAMEEAELKGINVQNIYDPESAQLVQQGTNSSLADYLFGTIADVAQEMGDLLHALSWQSVQFGVVNYQDPFTNLSLSLDYRDPEADYGYAPHGVMAHFPSDLTGTANDWTQSSTADGLRDIEEDVEQYIETNGFPPDVIVMSRHLRRHLINQESTRRATAQVINSNGGVIVENSGQVGYRQLDMLLQDRELPQLAIYDEQYHQEDTSGKVVGRRRFLNQDRYVFLKRGMGEQVMGPTLEADFAPGMHVVTRQVREYPHVDATQGVATALPLIPNPKLLFSRRVA